MLLHLKKVTSWSRLFATARRTPVLGRETAKRLILPGICATDFHSTSAQHVGPTSSSSNSELQVIGPDHVVRSPLPDIQLPTEDIYTLISKNFAQYGSRTALVNGISGREYSYNEIDEAICKFSSGLRRLGFERGQVLGIVTPNCPEYAVVFLGTLATGGVVSTCNPSYTVDELAYQFESSKAKIVVTIPDILPTVKEAASRVKNVDKIVVIGDVSPSGNVLSYNSLVEDSGSMFQRVEMGLDEVAILPYSSGTTGLPKGVMLTNCNVASNLLQMVHPELFSLQENESRLLGLLPFFHIYGMVVVLLSSLMTGTNAVTLPKFEPETFLSTIEKHRLDLAHVVPPLVVFLAKHPLVDKYDLSSVKEIMTGAAPLGGDTVKDASARTGCQFIRQGYGLTETSPVTHAMGKSYGMTVPSSIGHGIRSVKIRVVDIESEENLPPNKEGEVWLHGPNVMKGYLNNPQATRDCITEDGWFKSGDVGYYDDRGMFYITDRLKELIKVKGLQVAPAELEAVLLSHPGVVDAAVIGVPHEWLGEAPKAFVVRKEGLSEKEVEEFVASKLTRHKHLVGGVQFIEAVPKSPSGKILRRLLRNGG